MTMTANGLAKLIEECGELIQVAGKKLAYFHTNEHPDGARPLDVRLADEIADVLAACAFVEENMLSIGLRFNLHIRYRVKLSRFRQWHDEQGNNVHGIDNQLEQK